MAGSNDWFEYGTVMVDFQIRAKRNNRQFVPIDLTVLACSGSDSRGK
jgi:hypothetical protein